MFLLQRTPPKILWVEASSKDFAWIGRSQFPGLSISTSCNCGINGGNICVNAVTLFCISSLGHDEKIGDYFGRPQWNWAPWRLSKILSTKMCPSCNFSSHVFRVSHNHSMWIHTKRQQLQQLNQYKSKCMTLSLVTAVNASQAKPWLWRR